MAKKFNINLATRITLARIAMLPIILVVYALAVSGTSTFFHNWGRLIALVLFVIAAATDWLDGFIARKYNMVTNTGKLLDPVADKCLTVLGFVLILGDPIWNSDLGTFSAPTSVAFPYWFAVTAVFIALARDTVMNSLRFIAAEQGITIAADGMGKIKSTLQYVAITLYMLLAFNLNPFVQFVQDGIWLRVWECACVFALSTATVLSIWSCVNYVANYVKTAAEKAAPAEALEEAMAENVIAPSEAQIQVHELVEGTLNEEPIEETKPASAPKKKAAPKTKK